MILAGLCSTSEVDGDKLPLTGGTLAEFTTVQQGKSALDKQDTFVNSLSRFDKQARLNTNENVSTKEFLGFVSAQVLSWEEADKRKLAVVIAKIRPKLNQFQLPLPKKIRLVRTTGREEGEAAYCRGNAIVLPTKVVNRSPERLEHLMIHELFHVLSSHNPQLRRKLYAAVGFKPCGKVALPASLADRKLTNPDAPTIEHMIALTVDGTKQLAVPILYASVENYDPDVGGSFFRYLQFRLMVVEKRGKRFQPLLREGKPILIDPRKVPAYFDQIGRNTSYIIHPEEVLADNFVYLVSGRTDLKSPHIIEEMRRILSGKNED